jgi:hypothetical protein
MLDFSTAQFQSIENTLRHARPLVSRGQQSNTLPFSTLVFQESGDDSIERDPGRGLQDTAELPGIGHGSKHHHV